MIKELKISEHVMLITVESNNCDGCFFCAGDTCYNPTINGWQDGFECQAERREDKKKNSFRLVNVLI